MEDIITQFFTFHKHNNPYRFWANLIVAGLLLAGITYGVKYISLHCPHAGSLWDIYTDLLASLAAFIFAYYFVMGISKNLQRHEDEIKVSYHNSDMQKQYNPKGKDCEYRKTFRINNASTHNTVKGTKGKFIVYVDPLFLMKDCQDIAITDFPKKQFDLDPYIKMQTVFLLNAHTASRRVNEQTVRLENFSIRKVRGKKIASLTTSRSTYLAHMLTNRVIDYPFAPDISIRKIFENTRRLTPLSKSKLSNHIGINALVFLNDNILIMPKRGKDATVAKNGITASIASRLDLEGFEKALRSKKKSTVKDYIKADCVKDCFGSGLLLQKDTTIIEAVQKVATVRLLGLARDPYEGGKPTLFYEVRLNMDLNTFKGYMDPDYEPEGIDAVQELLFVKWDEIQLTGYNENPDEIKEDESYDKARLLLIPIYRQGKLTLWEFVRRKICRISTYTFEQNLISNFWFYLQNETQS